MKTTLIKYLIVLGLTMSFPSVYGQVPIVINGKSSSQIVITEPTSINRTAANILQDFIYKISDCKLCIKEGGDASTGDIIIGNSTDPKLSEDGFSIVSTDKKITITGKDKGAVYGAVTLLEDYLGVDYWGNGEYKLARRKNISIPEMSRQENPAFKFRRTDNYALQTDSLYQWWYRLEKPEEIFAANYWTHSFFRLMPEAEYGKTHPEYYAYFNGKRNPGAQLCLSNPDVFDIIAHRVDSIFKVHPDKNLISISQNDCSNNYCTCPECKKVDDAAGSPAGSLIQFVNKLAARFPDKEFATLAYQYTRTAPSNICPLPNVMIMLCDIECDRDTPLENSKNGKLFIKALNDWSQKTNNLLIWDYGINFDCFMSPFPNFYIIKDNLRLFNTYKVKNYFMQMGCPYCSDFAELRTYLTAKLIWNPNADLDKLMHHFLNRYYGEAGRYLYQYIQLMQGALWGSGQRLLIYDSPVSHKNGMLKPALIERYNQLFDQAEAAVRNCPTELERVKRSRLSLLYSELEIMRTITDTDKDSLARKLDYFEKEIRYFNNPRIGNQSIDAIRYCQLYRERYLVKESNLAQNAQIIYLEQPSGKYAKADKTTLTDGILRGLNYVDGWIGWEGKNGSLIIDLGEIKPVKNIETDFLHQLNRWVFFPKSVTYSYSTDNKKYQIWNNVSVKEEKSKEAQVQKVGTKSESPIPMRYIKIEINGTKICPDWHIGTGKPCWFFIDEIQVR